MSTPAPDAGGRLDLARARSSRLAVAVTVALALVLRLYGIGSESFWIDEVFQRDIAAQPLARIVADYRPRPPDGRLRDQAPLSHLVFHFFVGTGPQSDEASARLPSALAGAANAGLFLVLAHRLVPAGTAALATALLIFSPLDLWYGRELRFYELWVLLATAATYALARILAGGTRLAWTAYALLTIAGLYTCLMHALVVAAHAVTLAWSTARSERRTAFVRGALAVAAVVAIATLPIAWVVLNEHARPAGTPRPPSFAALPYTLFAFAAGYSLGPTVESLHALPRPLAVVRAHPSIVVVGAVFGLALVAGLRRMRRWPTATAVVLPLLVVPPLAVVALSFTTRIVYNVRYALPALTAFLLVVAAGCLAPRRPALRALAVAAVLAVTLVADVNLYTAERYDKANARDALATIRMHGEPAHVLIAGDAMRVVDYYTRGTATTWQQGCDAIMPKTRGTTLWIAASRDWEQTAPRCLERLATSHRVAEYHRFVGFELWRLSAR